MNPSELRKIHPFNKKKKCLDLVIWVIIIVIDALIHVHRIDKTHIARERRSMNVLSNPYGQAKD